MKPEILTISFEVIGVRIHLRTNESTTISVVLPPQSSGYDHLTINQLREAAIHHAEKQK